MNSRTTFHVLGLSALLAAPLGAQDFHFQIDSSASSSIVDNEIVLTLPSTVIGNHDAATNPTGTSTIPGVFGGSGNNVIPMDLALTIDSLFSGATSGSFGLNVDTGALTVSMDGLFVDLLNGANASTALSLSMLFSSFHTVQPTSVYLGGLPIDVPLGSTGVSQLELVQSGLVVPGALVPTGTPNEYSFVLTVPANMSFVVDFQGQTTPVGPTPVLLPLMGTILVNGNVATAAIDVIVTDQQQIMDPAPGFAITDQPMPMPTILPPGGTANLLLSATISQLDTDLILDVSVVADGSLACGVESYCDSTTNSTGQVALLEVTGSLDVNDGQLDYSVTNLPPNRPGIFFMGQSTANVPGFGGSQGVLCVGAPQIRYEDVQFSSLSGEVAYSPDFGNLPQGTVFSAGSTWYLQFWYRDSNPDATSNTANGVSIRFCP
jgi:hypothetical protein